MLSKKKIALVDDHIVVRSGLRELIEKIGAYEVGFEFDDGESLLENIAVRKEADLIILDLSLPGMNGESVVQELISRGCKIPVLVLSLNRDEGTIVRLFRCGVRGYLPKSCTATELRNALESVFSSGYYHNEFLVMSLQDQAKPREKSEQDRVLERLTVREREFLKLVCHEREYTYEQIADQMGVQHRTVDGYRETIFEKFGIKSKTGLVLFVLRHRLIELL